MPDQNQNHPNEWGSAPSSESSAVPASAGAGAGAGAKAAGALTAQKLMLALASVAAVVTVGGLGVSFLSEGNSAEEGVAVSSEVAASPMAEGSDLSTSESTSAEPGSAEQGSSAGVSAGVSPGTSGQVEGAGEASTSKAPARMATGEWGCNLAIMPVRVDNFTDPIYCASGWVVYGNEESGEIRVARAVGEEGSEHYQLVQPAQTHNQGDGFGCYDRGALQTAGATRNAIAALGDNGRLCDGQWTPDFQPRGGFPRHSGDFLSYAACNGEYVVIVESVLIPRGNDPMDEVLARMEAHPGATATYPGVCPSFRSETDGNLVYPIYVDYGNDKAAACAAEARGAGHARRLTRDGGWDSPC